MIPLLLLVAGAVSCPVLNTATARGAIGEVQLAVTQLEKSAGYTCRFTGAEAELTIEVSTLADTGQFSRLAESECQGGHEVAPLKAIGNEAVACSSGVDGQIVEKVAGRVRKQAFVIRLTTKGKSARTKITMLAEQVAGNLF